MEGLDFVLYKSGEAFSVFCAGIALLGVIVEIIAIIQGVRKWKESWGKKSKLIFISIVVGIFMIVAIGIGVSIRTNVLLEVPNVEGKLYGDAKAILIEHGFEFNTFKDSEDNFVLKQTPEAGSIRTKKTEIVLELEPVHVHRWEPTSVKEATCILTGEIRKECECGEVEIEVIPLTNHEWKDATCTEPKICLICEETEGEKSGHKEVIVEGYAATCTTDGLTDGKKCERCETVLEEQKKIVALDHKEVVIEGYAATCTTAGLTDGKKCSRCGVTIEEQKTIKALGHKEVTMKGYVATCTTAGLTDGKKCSRCGVTIEEQKTIKALGHKEVTLKGYAATCTTAGLTDGIKCSQCDKVIMARTIIEASGHKYDSDTDLNCNVCNYVRGYWSEYGAWSTWQDASVTENIYREVDTQEVVSAYNQKTQYKYSRYYGWGGSFWLALEYRSGVCQNYEETEWLDEPMKWSEVWSNAQERYNDGYGYGIEKDGKTEGKKIFWYNEEKQEVDDLNSPIYKTQYRCRERYIIYY